ncbi:MAG: tRNA (adenosine(37)-N6)-dimethylallyltransferase MiaA [Acidimicrobiaceae bacterium]|nr:tRNA (adenosine(37)-N6)-dimethylallyltransferase MiaA [Acidimicrobiaceae bacterium]
MNLDAALVGPTASGKSRLAHRLAVEFPGVEILSLDSMSVYRGMDTATAKPTLDERREVVYHLVDVVSAREEFSVADALQRVRALRTESPERFLLGVGGTGLYARAIIDDLEIPGIFPEVRAELDLCHDPVVLYEELRRLDPLGASRTEPTNLRRIRRALEVCRATGRPFSSFGPGLESYPKSPVLQVGLFVEFAELDRRIEERLSSWVEEGLIEEIAGLLDEGVSRAALQAVGYKEFVAYVAGECSLEDSLREAVAHTRRLARRQWRWFRRDPRVIWCDEESVAYDLLARALERTRDVGD